MADEVAFVLNGSERRVSVDAQTPLLYVLRNQMQLTGPRLGCGMGQCGACAVLVDGTEKRACIVTVGSVTGKAVTTLEGLPQLWAEQRHVAAGNGAPALHPVQQCWIDEQVLQCGYCQSGMMIAAVELLAHNPDPSVGEIKDAFTNKPPSPHLCRCGTYSAIVLAVQKAAAVMRK